MAKSQTNKGITQTVQGMKITITKEDITKNEYITQLERHSVSGTIAEKSALLKKAFVVHKDAITEKLKSRLKLPALVDTFTSKILTSEELSQRRNKTAQALAGMLYDLCILFELCLETNSRAVHILRQDAVDEALEVMKQFVEILDKASTEAMSLKFAHLQAGLHHPSRQELQRKHQVDATPSLQESLQECIFCNHGYADMPNSSV
jgi:hypothetical protein